MPYQVPREIECFICATQERGEQTIVEQTELSTVFIPEAMRAEGSVLVTPRRHVESCMELSDVESADLILAVRRIVLAIESAFDPDGTNIWWATGIEADQEYAHVVVEVVPRHENVLYVFSGLDEISSCPPERRIEIAEKLRRAVLDATRHREDAARAGDK